MTEKKAPPAAPPTIYHRLAKVSGAVAYLQKDGKNTGQGYSYLSEAHVKKAVTEALGANGLAYGGIDVEILDRYERETNRGAKWRGYDVRARVQIVSQEGGESVVLTGLGSGMDSGDKALMKATTAAVKTALTHGLGISSGDDPEADEATDVQFGDGYTGVAPTARRPGPPPERQRRQEPRRTRQASAPAPRGEPERRQERQEEPRPQTSGYRVSEAARAWRAPFGRNKGQSLNEIDGRDAQWFRRYYVDKLKKDPTSRYRDEWEDGIAFIDEVFGALEARAREAIEPPRQPERLPDPDQGRDEPDQGPGPDDEDDFPF